MSPRRCIVIWSLNSFDGIPYDLETFPIVSRFNLSNICLKSTKSKYTGVWNLFAYSPMNCSVLMWSHKICASWILLAPFEVIVHYLLTKLYWPYSGVIFLVYLYISSNYLFLEYYWLILFNGWEFLDSHAWFQELCANTHICSQHFGFDFVSTKEFFLIDNWQIWFQCGYTF